MGSWANGTAATWVLAAGAFVLAAAGARPYAGGWNDGSRLATVESLIERGTLRIDESVFVAPPAHLIERGTPPYAPGTGPNTTGTCDRLYINGHYYSDKPAVISVLMAGAYQPLMWAGAPRPSERPDRFAQLVAALTGGLAYAVAVGCMWVVGRRVGLPPALRLAWLAAFALCTVAPAYTRSVNNHIMQLAVVAAMCALLAPGALPTRGTALALGALAGIGFNLDFGSGPPLVALLGLFVVWRARRAGPVLCYALAALPWVAAGTWINYDIGGVLKPMNMVPEYSRWPGCPFDERNLTGFVRFGPGKQAYYLACTLIGSPGFLTHNLPLMLALVAGWGAVRRPFAGRAGLVCVLAWCAATWLLYGFLSNNYSGPNVSVRWFVPFLAPGFWLLAVVLRDRPHLRPQFAALAAWGAVLGALMWSVGPWSLRAVPLLPYVVGAGLLSWGAVAWGTRPGRASAGPRAAAPDVHPVRRAA
ncbi:MAG: hypothetical protein FJ304_07080 [Planctomycetes bacterium]|nr:hypothetical protein [Planctomycetota bacterium]